MIHVRPERTEILKPISPARRSEGRIYNRRMLLVPALMAFCIVVLQPRLLMASIEVKQSTSTTLKASATVVGYGTKLTLTAVVEPGTTKGTVAFYSGTKAIGSSAISGGSAKLSLSTLPVGSHVVKAVYLGSGTSSSSTSKSVTIKVTLPSTMTVLSSPDPSGKTVPLIAKVSPSKATGDVSFVIDYASGPFSLGYATLINGVATLHTPLGIPQGEQKVTAVYLGSADWASSVSNTITVTIK